MLPTPLPGGTTVRLGLADGPLLVALILGRIERTGAITWLMPVSANLTLRQIGLLLFLSGVGAKAGFAFVQILRSNGAQMLAAGALITLSTTLLALLIYPAAMILKIILRQLLV